MNRINGNLKSDITIRNISPEMCLKIGRTALICGCLFAIILIVDGILLHWIGILAEKRANIDTGLYAFYIRTGTLFVGAVISYWAQKRAVFLKNFSSYHPYYYMIYAAFLIQLVSSLSIFFIIGLFLITFLGEFLLGLGIFLTMLGLVLAKRKSEENARKVGFIICIIVMFGLLSWADIALIIDVPPFIRYTDLFLFVGGLVLLSGLWVRADMKKLKLIK